MLPVIDQTRIAIPSIVMSAASANSDANNADRILFLWQNKD